MLVSSTDPAKTGVLMTCRRSADLSSKFTQNAHDCRRYNEQVTVGIVRLATNSLGVIQND